MKILFLFFKKVSDKKNIIKTNRVRSLSPTKKMVNLNNQEDIEEEYSSSHTHSTTLSNPHHPPHTPSPSSPGSSNIPISITVSIESVGTDDMKDVVCSRLDELKALVADDIVTPLQLNTINNFVSMYINASTNSISQHNNVDQFVNASFIHSIQCPLTSPIISGTIDDTSTVDNDNSDSSDESQSDEISDEEISNMALTFLFRGWYLSHLMDSIANQAMDDNSQSDHTTHATDSVTNNSTSCNIDTSDEEIFEVNEDVSNDNDSGNCDSDSDESSEDDSLFLTHTLNIFSNIISKMV